jgi:periplasmic divalent cation tolerance protein
VTENDKAPDHGLVEGTLPGDCVAALIYSTFPSRDTAIVAGRELIERRLAGCINILPGMTSVYAWKGTVEVADEAVLLAKVLPYGVAAASEALLRLHPYETPALLVLPVPMVGKGYLDWLGESMDAAPAAGST